MTQQVLCKDHKCSRTGPRLWFAATVSVWVTRDPRLPHSVEKAARISRGKLLRASRIAVSLFY